MKIDDFRFNYRWLSNYQLCKIKYKGDKYISTEHAYQAAKTLDKQQHDMIRDAPTCVLAKKLGGQCSVRSDWYAVRDRVMYDVCKIKFTNNLELRQLLIDTGDTELIEGNTWNDTYWGVCNNVGQNKLGQILMRIRSDL